ncbi:transient receptor potential cation channel subfamily A member 1 [Leptidea sinapis]|uniref:transient receptor potential cation channel subfamily A member 1 n=1 Tax=Leptidea sinapis TaxID=189913 RepID=UPI0021C2CA6B|nr:transient receptor potential cation channel subfamily A member 1 [Leptidea sinapis]
MQIMWLFKSGRMDNAPNIPVHNNGPATVSSAEEISSCVQVNIYNDDHRKAGFSAWLRRLPGFRRSRRTKISDPGGELQIMLPNTDRMASGDVCLLTESPYRILRAAESGNVDEFMRLYINDPARLTVRDSRGRTAGHQAASRDNTNILRFIRKYAGDLNARDNAGNTPLHVAIESEALQAIEYLLQQHVETGILNEKYQAPIHLATEINKVSVLEIFAKYKSQFDVNLGGQHGRTALHIAAIYDYDQCARVLMAELDAECKHPCNNGYYPIHEAAKNASSKTMEVFLQFSESKGCPREQMISLYDNEGNVPLHSAVHSGDIKAVELCLKSGAKISTQQHDFSTPVHLACAQGGLEMVKLMFTMQPNEKESCLTSCDVQKMTPIHCAAMFDHREIVKYLVEEGSDINPLDKERRSPLLLAASRGAWRTLYTLIQLGADVELKDINTRNVLHLVVMNGGRLEEFAEQCKDHCEKSLATLLNEKDNTGCSPLHYASREGHIRSLKNLIRFGACINPKNEKSESPLHFAARYGRYQTACQLLDSEKGTFIINESDGDGLTPLHIASREGHTRVVQLLLNRGALLHRDHNGRNPLHLAAMGGYTQTIGLLHSVHSHMLDQLDKDLNSPLHLATMENRPNSIALLLSMGCRLSYNALDMSAIDYAIYYKFPDAALAMVTHEERAHEVMALRSDRHPCVTLALIAYMPKVFEAVQDKCIIKANCKKDSKKFFIKYSFETLNPKIQYDDQNKNQDSFINSPLPALNAMVAHGRVELLAHPLSQKYLEMKWNSYGKYFHLANLLFYCIFLAFVTTYGYLLMKNVPKPKKETDVLNDTAQLDNIITQNKNITTLGSNFEMVSLYTSMVGIISYNGICFIGELYNMKQQKWHYLIDPSNFVSWILYVSSTLMVCPSIANDQDLQFSAAAITMFLSWFELLLLLQRFDQIGIYVVMFLEILQTLIKVLMVFSILIIAFGLSFYVLLSKGHHLSFTSIPMSLMRTFAMMLGEIDFVGTYIHPYYKSEADVFLPFPLMTFNMLGLFMVFMPILLMNLLIGLAVGDIESVRRNAQLKRLAMQVVLHTELERTLPAFILEKVDKTEIIEFPNNKKCKLGFLDNVLRKWFCNPFSEESGVDLVLESSEDYISIQLEKQKRRLRDINHLLDQQQTLLRLIVQKMEIKTEADDVDEGIIAGEIHNTHNWSSPRIRKKLQSRLSFNKVG